MRKRRAYILTVSFPLFIILIFSFVLIFFTPEKNTLKNNNFAYAQNKTLPITNNWGQVALQRSIAPILGLPPVLHPKDNLPTTDKIKLGRKLFFDRRLSINGTMSCAMCHVPEQGFTSHEVETAVGVEGRTGRRNSPTILNTYLYKHLFVDGRDHSLETQYINPLTARNEMANPSAGHVIHLLKTFPDYKGLFENAFGAPPSLDTVGKAFAAYQRTLIAGNSRFDRWHYGKDQQALSPSEQRGFQIFIGKGNCVSCHLIEETHAKFTDNQFHDIGYGWWREQQRQNPLPTTRVELAPGVFVDVAEEIIAAVGTKIEADLGRYEVTEKPNDRWKFRTPSLRNLSLTPPYMHDGKFATIRDVLKFYNRGGQPHKAMDPRIKPLNLTSVELDDLENFLKTLNSQVIEQLIKEARSSPPDNF
ncbi:MAG: cytochrome c peroxidase [Hyphomicrobiales bacterium]